MKIKIGKRVRVIAYDIPKDMRTTKTGGVRTHYGIVQDVVKDMFNGDELFIIKIKDKVNTYTKESIINYS